MQNSFNKDFSVDGGLKLHSNKSLKSEAKFLVFFVVIFLLVNILANWFQNHQLALSFDAIAIAIFAGMYPYYIPLLFFKKSVKSIRLTKDTMTVRLFDDNTLIVLNDKQITSIKKTKSKSKPKRPKNFEKLPNKQSSQSFIKSLTERLNLSKKTLPITNDKYYYKFVVELHPKTAQELDITGITIDSANFDDLSPFIEWLSSHKIPISTVSL